EDVVVAPRATLPIEVFCVEHGRWSSERKGADTRAFFKSADAIAVKAVRENAQYEKSQENVWHEVALVGGAGGGANGIPNGLASPTVSYGSSFLRVLEDAP